MAGSDIEYLKKIGLMEKNEHVILFENHDGKPFAAHPQSGNFFTDKRIAAYWIDKDPKLTSKNFAYYRDIDSITVKDRSTALTYASYLTVYKHDGRKFKVFVDGNRRKVDYFFKSALEEWSKNKPKISKSL
nr:hypothetical protein [uncultured Mucilaginibacter sp.]